MLWHQTILFGFFKLLFDLREVIKIFLLKNSPSQNIFFYGKCFVLDSPKTWFLVLEVCPFYLDSKPNAFHLGKFLLKNLLNSPRAFWVIFSPFQNSSCHDLSGNPLPKAFPHLCIKLFFKSSKLNLSIYLFPFTSHQKQFLPSILILGGLQGSYPFCFEFCLQTNFPS